MSDYLSVDLGQALIIDDDNANEFVGEVSVDGEPMARGLLPRDYNEDPFEGFCSPFPLPLIPRSEWVERIKDIEKDKARLTDFARLKGIKSLNQGSTNYCTTEDTEVLTERGWVQWPNYNGHDLLGTMNQHTGQLEFQAPLDVQVFEHDGPMIYSTNRSVDFAVTPNHRMFVRKWDESRRKLADHYTFQRAGDLGWYFGLPPATTGFVGTRFKTLGIDGDRTYSGNDFIALCALVVSDGYAGGTENTRNWVSFACFREDRLAEVRLLAQRLGFTEKSSSPGVFIRYDAGALANWFRSNAYVGGSLGSQNKKVPDFVKLAAESQIKLFLEWYGDQSHDRGNHFFSTSKRAIDDLQELHLRVGQRSSIWTEDRAGKEAVLETGKVITSRKAMFHLHVRQREALSIDRKEHLEEERYVGNVYCATVPNSTLVTRRNGSILISGNCWINAPVQAMQFVRARQRQEHVALSPASAGAIIKNYRNVGGWGTQGVKFLSEVGCVPVSKWPANAIDKRFDTAETRELRNHYRFTEWWDIPPKKFDYLATCLLERIPAPIGLTWWMHEVMAADLVKLDGAGRFGVRIWNSWGEKWGNNGTAILTESKATPDDVVAPRVALAA